MPSEPSSNDLPHAPWAWISTYPGVIMDSPASTTWESLMPNRRHAASKSGFMVPVATIECPSETSHVWLRTPCASIFFAPQIAKGAASSWNNPVIRLVSCFRCSSMIFFLSNMGRGVCGSGFANPCTMGNGQVSLRWSAIAVYVHRRNGNSLYDEGVRRLPRR